MSRNVVGGAAILAVAVALMGTGGALAHRVEPSLTGSQQGLSRSQQEKLGEAASASLFGQFRSSMADFLWLKVDKYLHNGVDLRGLTPEEKRGATGKDEVSSAKGSGQWKHTGDETTVVPSKDLDWRGVFGDVEREVSPYKDMRHHTHRDPKEALPLFRLMVLSNPHFIPGYVTGAAMIAREPDKIQEAIDFLLEGEKNNPDNIEIETAIGMLMTDNQRHFAQAVPYLRKAIAAGSARDPKTLTDDESDAYENAYRWLILNRREAKDLGTARQVAIECLKLYPHDVVASNFLRDHKSTLDAPRLKGYE